MPVIVTDFTWTQTEDAVRVHVPLKGARACKVDIISTDRYLKVHFPPFLFEAFLYRPVDENRSSAKIGNGVAVFTLMKTSRETWEQLMMSCDKETKQQLREEVLLKHQQKLSSQSRSKAEKQQAEKKYLLETMMKLEQDVRDNIQKMKEAERQKTTAELEAWQEICEKTNTNEEEEDLKKKGKTNSENIKQPVRTCKKKTEQKRTPPRTSGNIQVTFTPRVFPTALRESRVQEEEEWLKNQAEARRSRSSGAEDLQELSENEKNPEWLKDKGDCYFRSGDYQSAVNAYSLALRLNQNLLSVWSNRAASHLKLRNLHQAVQDSSQALDLSTPAVPSNAASRARAHVHRGAAFCELELYVEGLQDYEAALKIFPDSPGLQSDAQKIRDVIEGRETTSASW
ncbi:dynein axonemal assembly factor 4 isoform X1 [Cynoglossus semilaevis]|uniref:dynein axonemal assembly factor 4 isoform X1 n=2 Tax=Cynoglossus semilaevis TaxID=244447 RepID=UPI0007DC9C79|nr:dynein assembly factor 4, axonemal-like isoform X1 [Cynoglossus semilaevis]